MSSRAQLHELYPFALSLAETKPGMSYTSAKTKFRSTTSRLCVYTA